MKPGALRRADERLQPEAVVSTLPTSTTNITGFRTWWRGSSFRNDATMAPRTISGSKRGRAFACVDIVVLAVRRSS
jgi:hypothetical protein